MEVAQVEPACTVDCQPVKDPPVMRITWTIENFTWLNTKKHYSDMFVVGGYKWRILIFPMGNKVDYLSMYLDVADSGTMPYGWSTYAHFSLAVVNQIHSKYSIRKDTQHQFNARESHRGFTSFMPLGYLYDPSRGYLVNDTVVVEAEISVLRVLGYGSYDSKKETGYVGLKNQGATGYMNSLLQTWYHIPYFRKAVHHMPTTENDMPSRSIPLALQRLFYKLRYSESSVATKELTKSFGWDAYDSFMQHDVQELNRVLCEKLEDKMKGTVVEGTVQQLFEGHHMNYIECINVDYKSTRRESFYDLQLDVKGCRDVYASFDKYVEVERLEGDNKYHAEEHGLQDAKKGVLFIDFPPVLQLQLKRFEYDFMWDTMVKINDRYEFPLQLDLDRENGKYLSPKSDKSVRNLYTLHSVLVHSDEVHGGHYYAFIRPTLSDQWYKFDDEHVTKEDVKRALEEQYGGEVELPQTNPGFNNTPFKFTKYSNAYMLVYIRDSDKDKIICNVDKKDIAEHLRIRLTKEQEEKENKRRYKAKAHLYRTIKVARDEDLTEQIGRDIYFDLVDHDKVRSFRIQNQTPFNLFKEEVAKVFGIPVQFQRFWIWAKRQNHTYRPDRPLTPQEETQSVGQLREVSNKTHNAELRLFLEVEFGPDLRPIPPPVKTKEDILLFFKLYEPEKQELRFVGRFFVKSSSNPAEILGKLNQLAGFTPDEEIELYEEIKFEPCIMCEHLDKKTSFQLSEIEDGDIICFQKSISLESEEECKYPDAPSFLEYIHNRQVFHFHSLEKPKEEDFSLELSKLHTYDDVVEKLARQIGLEDPTKIRLTAHNCYSEQPTPQPIKFRRVKHLTDMLVHYNQISHILYYEVLDIPLPELQGLKNLKVAFHHATKDEVVIHNIRLPKQSTVGDVINVLKKKVELSHPNAELRLLEVFNHKIYKIFPHSEKIENINDQFWTLRAEEIPEEEKNLGPHDRLIHVYHFTINTAQNQMQVQNFGEPFFLVIDEGETLAEVKERIEKKLRVPNKVFAKWKFAFLSLGRPEYLQDSDVVSSRFQRRDVSGAWEQYLGLEHSDKAPKSAHATNQYLGLQHSDKAPKGARTANQASAVVNTSFPTSICQAEPTPQEDAAQVTLEFMVSNVGHETASREVEKQNDDLDGPASQAVDRTLRRLSAAEDLLKSTSAREPSVEALAALDTVSRYASSSLDTLCTNGAYEEFKAALKLVTEQGMIPSTTTSMFKDLLSSLEGEMPKYVDAVKELAQTEGFPVEHEKIKAQMGLAVQKCQERKDIVANYDAKVTELEAELARVKAERAKAMADLETAVDEMEPLKQRFADSSLKSENMIVRQTTLALQKRGSVGTWAVLQDALKKYFKF
ncbi:ubiquitin C-terminal hydrolase 12-like isoform X1 [Pyrus x bretschneideri]|uniref:ubiquitin C-terminal hydrolase 12-like isoform X1 n=1 Tax=Pyrus x bretschneideri TaxID=225117 RepID=UPI00051140B5|nr:ubiquitin C-terminal hydrolase 12-like isoform X1 [Pyrus x bretschneideri]